MKNFINNQNYVMLSLLIKSHTFWLLRHKAIFLFFSFVCFCFHKPAALVFDIET